MNAAARFDFSPPLTRGLDSREVARLAALFETRRFRAGDLVVAEGAPFGTLCVVSRGEVVVEKGRLVLDRLGAGALLGELSFVDGGPASATVRAATDCAVLCLDRARLDAVGGPLAERLRRHAAEAAVARLRSAGDALREEVGRRADLGRFLVLVVVMFGLGNAVQRLIVPGLAPALHIAYSWGFLLLVAGLCAQYVWGRPLAALGLTRARFGGSVLEGLGLAAVVIGGAVVWRLSTSGGPLLTLGSVAAYSPVERAVFFTAYPVHCFLQEWVARGVCQGSLERFLGDTRPLAGTVVTAVLFGVFHLYVSVAWALGTFLMSLVFGALYARHRTLAGVTVAHALIGVAAVLLGLN